MTHTIYTFVIPMKLFGIDKLATQYNNNNNMTI